MNKQHKMTTWN